MKAYRLEYLEQITPPHNTKWAAYALARVPMVQTQIDRLRNFASKRTGRVADIVNADADKYQARLDLVAATL